MGGAAKRVTPALAIAAYFTGFDFAGNSAKAPPPRPDDTGAGTGGHGACRPRAPSDGAARYLRFASSASQRSRAASSSSSIAA